MPERASHPYLAVAVAGASAFVLRFGLAWILWAVLLDYHYAYEPFFRPLPPGVVLILLLVPCALAVWLSRLYAAPVGRRLAVCLALGILIAAGSLVIDLGHELVVYWRRPPFWMWQTTALKSVGIALAYAFVTGLIAGVVGLWRSKLSRTAESS